MKTKALLVIPIVLLFSNPAQGQDWFTGISYGVAFPTSDTKDFTENTSWRNWSFDVLYELRPNTALGVSFGWNVFNVITDFDDVTSLENVDVGGIKFRYTNSFPMLATIRQFVGTEGGMRPFFGLGVGTQLVKRAVDVSTFRISGDTWHFALAPEIGVVLPLNSDAKWFLGAKYNYGVKSSDRTESYFGLNIGVAWQTGGF